MATASMQSQDAGPWSGDLRAFRCPSCSGGLAASGAGLSCVGCGTPYPIRDNVLIVKAWSDENNRIAQDFYDSPLWPRFRFWEKFTWFCNGGEKRARNQVLKHLPNQPGLKLLDVAVGDGVYLPWMPADWDVVGIDVSWSQLSACLPRAKGRAVRLIQGEAENLPVRDAQFDAVLSIGAFNYFNDPEGSLREMARATRPGGTIVISDEMPNLTDRMLGHKLGFPALDRWIVSRLMHLGDPFTDMVERYRDMDVRAIAERVLPGVEYHEVWRGLGYVLVGRVPG
jgi:ubiquinone/menaquinone biosynthesis C-methylase UbiE